MATSAAVIGRQLRQQASSSRISGPVVPPTQYKGSGSSARAAAAAAAAAALSRTRPSSFSSGHNARQNAGSISRQSSQNNQANEGGYGLGSSQSPLARSGSFYGGGVEWQNAHPQQSSLGGSNPTVLSSSLLLNHHHNNNHNFNNTLHTTGADADKNFAKFSQLYSHEFYPHPAHRAEAAAALGGDGRGGDRRGKKRSGDKKSASRRVFFSSRCWWVAVKAHCPGVVLVLVGTLMSVVGFYADSLSEVEDPPRRLENGTLLSAERRTDDSLKAQLHNLTYVGPVIMGLGGMVLVAACVLTFEVRDTLGVQLAAVQPEHSPEKKKAKAKEKVAAEDGRKKQRTKRGGEVSPQGENTTGGKGAAQPPLTENSSRKQQQHSSVQRDQPTSGRQHQQSNGYPPKSTYSTVNLAGALLTADIPQQQQQQHQLAPPPPVHHQSPSTVHQSEVAVIEISSRIEEEINLTTATPIAAITPSRTLSSPPSAAAAAAAVSSVHRYQQHQQQQQQNSHHHRPLKSSSAHYYSHHYAQPSPAHLVRPHSTTATNSASHSTSDLFSIDMSFVRIPSPAETELSDPEGCSLHTLNSASAHSLAMGAPFPSRWRSRCSCGGSPTNSMVLALAGAGGGTTQWLSTYPPPPSQLPNRYSKILASVESDGLSASTASSEWDIRGGGGGGGSAPMHLLMHRRSSATIISESSASREQRMAQQQAQQQQAQQQQHSLFYGTSSSSGGGGGGRKSSRGSLNLPISNSSSHSYNASVVGYPLLELPTPTSPHS